MLAQYRVRRYLREADAQRYGPRAPRPCKLEPYHRYLRERIEQARPRWIPATVLLREIAGRGYDSGISQLKAWLAPLKNPAADPLVRFETAAGVQMQADFTVVRRGRDPLLALVATLGYSRASFVNFTVAEDATTLCAARSLRLLRRRAGRGAVRQRQERHHRTRCLRRRSAPLEHRPAGVGRRLWLQAQGMPTVLGQAVEDLLEQLPWPMRVGVRQRRTRGRLHAQVRQLALAALESALDLAQRVRPSKLAEHHRYQLRPTGEALAGVLHLGLLDQTLELGARNQLEQLAEHAA